MLKKILLIIIILSNLLHAYGQITLTQKEKIFIQNHPTITLGTGDSWAPFIMKNSSGQNIGYDNDILKIINKVTGANFVQVLGNWSQIQKNAKKHKIDGLSTLGVYEERKKWFNFSNIYITLPKMVLVKQKNQLNIQSNVDLNGKTISIHKGNMIDKKIADKFKNSKIIYANTVEETLKQVIYGKADATFGNSATTYILSKLGLPYLDFAYQLDDKLELAFAVRKDWPEAISILNKGLSTISEFKKTKLKQAWFGRINNTYNKNIFSKEEEIYLKGKKQITMCVDPDWMPYEKLEDGKHIGMVADYFNIFQKEIGIPIKVIVTKTWSETLAVAKNRKCDIISLAMKTEKRKKYLNFTKPYVEMPFVLATKPNVSFINNLDKLKKEKIGVIKGHAINEILRKKYHNINIINVKNISEGLQKVVNGELFGFIDNIASIGYMLQSNFLNELKITSKFDEKWKLGIAIRSDDLILLNIFNKVISILSPHIKQDILNNYVSIKYEQGFDYSLFWKIFGAIFILAIGLLVRYITISKYNKEIEKYIIMIDNNVLISSSDINGKITHVSKALCRLTGYTKNELIGKGHNIFRHKDMPESVFENMWDTLKSGKFWQGEVKNLNKDGSHYWANIKINLDYNKNKTLKGYTAIRNDITDKKQIEKLSLTDTLTQIPNRRYLDKEYELELKRAQRYNTIFSIIIIDIDFFKQVNDTYGHQVGDDILIQVAQLLNQNIRNTDILGRWGGEEFFIISPETNIEESKNLASKLKDVIEYFDFPVVRSITCSFGLSQYNQKDEKNDTFKRADKALYQAKKSGRNRVITS